MLNRSVKVNIGFKNKAERKFSEFYLRLAIVYTHITGPKLIIKFSNVSSRLKPHTNISVVYCGSTAGTNHIAMCVCCNKQYSKQTYATVEICLMITEVSH